MLTDEELWEIAKEYRQRAKGAGFESETKLMMVAGLLLIVFELRRIVARLDALDD
jgi:hypothetical protein